MSSDLLNHAGTSGSDRAVRQGLSDRRSRPRRRRWGRPSGCARRLADRTFRGRLCVRPARPGTVAGRCRGSRGCNARHCPFERRETIERTLADWFDGPWHILLDEEIVGLGSFGHTLAVFSSDKLSEDPGPHPKSRMKPLQDRAYEGRVNSKGIPCLYFATTHDVAMAEVRPWIGSVISVGRFQTDRPLRVVDCSLLAGPEAPNGTKGEIDSVEGSVWASIDRAFSRPVTRSDNTAEYAATQVLAEVFRNEGHDGILYKSAFSVDRYNIALFDLNCAHQIDSSLFVAENASFTFREIG